MNLSQSEADKGQILYDADLTGQVGAHWFDPDWWETQGRVTGCAQGRGTTLFVRYGDQQWVLRPYRRGGLPARISSERYIWTGLEATRPWREMRLLAWMRERALPVPGPVAAWVEHRGLGYRGAIITTRLSGTTLTERAVHADLEPWIWEAVGRCLRRFHQQGVDHADLNANNILIDDEGRVSVLDFDRGRRRVAGRWRQRNLDRLKRSLHKYSLQHDAFAFSPQDWDCLLRGYGAL